MVRCSCDPRCRLLTPGVAGLADDHGILQAWSVFPEANAEGYWPNSLDTLTRRTDTYRSVLSKKDGCGWIKRIRHDLMETMRA